MVLLPNQESAAPASLTITKSNIYKYKLCVHLEFTEASSTRFTQTTSRWTDDVSGPRVSVINSVLLVVLWGLKTFLLHSDTNLRNCSGQTLSSLTSSDRRKAADGMIHQGRTEGVCVRPRWSWQTTRPSHQRVLGWSICVSAAAALARSATSERKNKARPETNQRPAGLQTRAHLHTSGAHRDRLRIFTYF